MLYTLEEHKNKKLIVGDKIEERAQIVGNINQENVQILQESAKDKKKRKLIVKMEAIHVGRTKNFTYYTEEGLKAGLKSWTQPYNKPVLTHHNSYSGEPVGRILEAEYSDKTLSGKPGLIFTVEITDPDAIEKVLDGRYQTVSIGASTDKVTCNICGTDRTQEWCDHYPGKKYDEQTCHFIIGTTLGREVSYVNTPSDENAGNRSIQVVEEDETGDTKESVQMQVFQMAEGLYQDAANPEVNLYEHLNKDVKQIIDLMTAADERSETMPEEHQTQEEVKDETKIENPEEQQADKGEVDEGTQPSEGSSVEEQVSLEEFNQLKGRIAELQESVSNLVLENQRLESKIKTMEEENDRLVQENAELIEANHLALAEKVVDLKHKLRKADVIGVKREEAVAEHVKRTKESLTDTLNDLLNEAKATEAPEPGSVTNPGLAEGEEHKGNKEKMTVDEGVNLMMNMFSRKRK